MDAKGNSHWGRPMGPQLDSKRTPTAMYVFTPSTPAGAISWFAHSCSEDRKDTTTQQDSTFRSSCPTLAWELTWLVTLRPAETQSQAFPSPDSTGMKR